MSAAELAARRYIDAWFEPDRDWRAALLEVCFAVDGRISVLGTPLHGRAQLAAEIEAFQADPLKHPEVRPRHGAACVGDP